jgi:hypothetical protein
MEGKMSENGNKEREMSLFLSTLPTDAALLDEMLTSAHRHPTIAFIALFLLNTPQI